MGMHSYLCFNALRVLRVCTRKYVFQFSEVLRVRTRIYVFKCSAVLRVCSSIYVLYLILTKASESSYIQHSTIGLSNVLREVRIESLYATQINFSLRWDKY
jgi:hypothetical protein